jgi:two-component system sensor histidine kinase EvgS
VWGINAYLASRNGITNLKVNAGFDVANGQAYGVRNDWPELVPLLEKALASIPEAQVQDIYSRWIFVSVGDIRIPGAILDKKALDRIVALPELRVGVLKNRPPFDFVDTKGAHKGLAADIFGALVKHTGFKTQVIPAESTEALLAQLSNSELDMVLSVNGAAPGVPAKLLSEPYLVSSLGVFVPKGGILLGEMRDLFDRRVVVPANGLSQPMLSAYPRIQLQTVSSLQEGVKAVLDDRADFLVAETTSALREIEEAGITGLRYAGPLGEAPVRLSLAVSPQIKGQRELIDPKSDSYPGAASRSGGRHGCSGRVTAGFRFIGRRDWLDSAAGCGGLGDGLPSFDPMGGPPGNSASDDGGEFERTRVAAR